LKPWEYTLVETDLVRQSSEYRSKYLRKRLGNWVELGRFEPNVNFTDAMEKIARVGRSERSMFSLGLIEGGTVPWRQGERKVSTLSPSVFLSIIVYTRGSTYPLCWRLVW